MKKRVYVTSVTLPEGINDYDEVRIILVHEKAPTISFGTEVKPAPWRDSQEWKAIVKAVSTLDNDVRLTDIVDPDLKQAFKDVFPKVVVRLEAAIRRFGRTHATLGGLRAFRRENGLEDLATVRDIGTVYADILYRLVED